MALAGIEAMDCAVSSVFLSASAVPMSGFGAPVRTATPMPTRATSGVGPGTSLRTRSRVFPNILGYDTNIKWNTARGHLDQFRRRAVTNDDLMAGRAFEHGGDLFHEWAMPPPPAIT